MNDKTNIIEKINLAIAKDTKKNESKGYTYFSILILFLFIIFLFNKPSVQIDLSTNKAQSAFSNSQN